MTNSSKKKILSVCLVVILVATFVMGATLAYFSDKDEKENTFVIGEGIDLTLEEEQDPAKAPAIPGEEDPVAGEKTEDGGLKYDPVIPGVCYSKAPYINLTGQDAHVYMELTMTKAEYEALYAAAARHAEDVGTYIAEMVKFPADVSHKLVGLKASQGEEDTYGVVLYYGVLAPQERYFLMNGIKVPSEFDNTDMASIKNASGADGLQLNVRAYAIQADFVTEEEAFDSCFVDLGYTYQG